MNQIKLIIPILLILLTLAGCGGNEVEGRGGLAKLNKAISEQVYFKPS